MEATARHLQDPAHLLNTPLSAVLIDEAVARHYRPSEKMASAFFNISRSRRSRPFSRCRSHTWGSLAGRWPVPGNASSPCSRKCRFQREIIPLPIPKRCSTSVAWTPSSDAKRMASSLNYRSNFFCPMDTPPQSEIYGLFEVSTRAGEIQISSSSAYCVA